MAVRVDVETVQLIIETDLTEEQIEQCIGTANILVDTHCVGKGLSSSLLIEIEKWLSAHFIAVIDGQILSEKADVVSQWYVRKLGLGLQNTSYGQQALALDSSGSLRAIDDKRYTATVFESINVLGD